MLVRSGRTGGAVSPGSTISTRCAGRTGGTGRALGPGRPGWSCGSRAGGTGRTGRAGRTGRTRNELVRLICRNIPRQLRVGECRQIIDQANDSNQYQRHNNRGEGDGCLPGPIRGHIHLRKPHKFDPANSATTLLQPRSGGYWPIALERVGREYTTHIENYVNIKCPVNVPLMSRLLNSCRAFRICMSADSRYSESISHNCTRGPARANRIFPEAGHLPANPVRSGPFRHSAEAGIQETNLDTGFRRWDGKPGTK